MDTALRPIMAAITSSAPGIQIEATSLLAQCLMLHNAHSEHDVELNSAQRLRIVKPLLPTLAKISQHRSPECREASFQAFAAVRLFLDMPSSGFISLTDGLLDEQRRLKVDVAYDLLQSEEKKVSKKSKRQENILHESLTDLELQKTKKNRKPRNMRKNRSSGEIEDDPPSSG